MNFINPCKVSKTGLPIQEVLTACRCRGLNQFLEINYLFQFLNLLIFLTGAERSVLEGESTSGPRRSHIRLHGDHRQSLRLQEPQWRCGLSFSHEFRLPRRVGGHHGPRQPPLRRRGREISPLQYCKCLRNYSR